MNVYYEKRGLDRDLILTLGSCGFIEKNQPVVFNGFTGSGKSYLACAIGRQASLIVGIFSAPFGVNPFGTILTHF